MDNKTAKTYSHVIYSMTCIKKKEEKQTKKQYVH